MAVLLADEMEETGMSTRATVKIPAEYVEDARRAIMHEINLDGQALEAQDPIERSWSTLVLKRDTALLEQLLGASSDLTVEAECDGTSSPILHMLETMIRQTIGRLEEQCVYGPLPVENMLPLLNELRWAMSEAARLNPMEAAR